MDLLSQIAKRLVGIVVVVVTASFLLSLLTWLLPGDPAQLASGNATPEMIAQVRTDIGLDRGVFGYFFKWLSNMFQGDFGNYYSSGAQSPVMDAVKRTLPVSLQLIFYAQIVALALSIPLGLIAAYKENSKFDKILTNSLFTLVSFPNFAMALILIVIISLKLGWVDPVGYVKPSEDLVQHLKLMILPVTSIAIGLTSSYTRLLRTDVIATLKEDYVTMAASKGISNRRILWRHVFRPSSTTLLTSAALNMGALIGGTIVIETIFVVPGIGYEIFAAIGNRQVIAMQSLIALVAFAYVFFNSVIDIVTQIVDPRTRERRV
jgi:peptide/nickel transport system permease protein